jgi:glycosyltransferase involved in cell wall biosynthesis
MVGFYAAMDMICLTSKNEGTPVTLIEAQASGVPVISTNVGGVQDIILAEETGIILTHQAHEALAENLLTLSLNEHLRSKMSQNARNFVKHRFSYHRLVEDMDQLYKQELMHE